MSIFNSELLRRAKDFYSSVRVPSKEKKKSRKTELDDLLKYHTGVTNTEEKDVKETLTEWNRYFGDEPTESSVIVVNDINDDLKTLLQMFADNGIRVKMTSGFREGAVTSNGQPSFHSTGEAMDIVPEDGDFEALRRLIKSNPTISAYMKAKGYGIVDESTSEMLNRTGGSGPHFHVGKDRLGQRFWMENA